MAIKYDSIVPPVVAIIKKPSVYIGLTLFFVALVLMQDWGTTPFAPGAESAERYGFLVPRTALFIAFIFFIVSFLYFLVRAVTTADDKPNQKICTECLEIFEHHMVTSNICPKCSGAIEKVSGVFDRKPELLERIKSKET